MLVSTPVLPASATEEKASLCSIFFSSSSFPSLSLSRFFFRTHARSSLFSTGGVRVQDY